MNLKSILSLAILCCSIQWSAAQWSFELGALNFGGRMSTNPGFNVPLKHFNYYPQLGVGYRLRNKGQINVSYRPIAIESASPLFIECYTDYDYRLRFNQWFGQEFGLGYEFQVPLSMRFNFLAELGTTYSITNYNTKFVGGWLPVRTDHMLGLRAKAKLSFRINNRFSILYSFNIQYGQNFYNYKLVENRSGNFGIFSIEPLHGISLRYSLHRTRIISGRYF